MSYLEYLDLYLLAQNNPDARYHVISFDVIGSTSMTNEERSIVEDNLLYIIKYVYNKLLEKEIEFNKQILINDERFITPWSNKIKNYNGNFIDPYMFGDCIEFTVINDSVSKEEIIDMVNECKEKLDMKEDFHVSDAYYETNNYEEGNTKYYRGYCLATLNSLHKPFLQKELRKVKNKVVKKNEYKR